MQSQTKQTQARGRALLQMDLFAGDPQKAIDDRPVWSELPTEVQTTLTSLITRLLMQHADKSRLNDGGWS
jgi:hypothetical protein